MQKGTVNVAGDWTGGPATAERSELPAESLGSEAGYRRCQGEAMRGNPRLKTAMESSVRSKELASRARMQPEPGRYFSVTGCARHGHAAATSRFGVRSALPGVQPSTYSTKGLSFEHGNLDPSAGPAKPGRANRSGDVSDGGRSLRSSSRAGKPRTWRREAVMGTPSRPPGKAMYVAPRPDWDWLRIEQRKLYTRRYVSTILRQVSDEFTVAVPRSRAVG